MGLLIYSRKYKYFWAGMIFETMRPHVDRILFPEQFCERAVRACIYILSTVEKLRAIFEIM